jgi:hypothetical protein
MTVKSIQASKKAERLQSLTEKVGRGDFLRGEETEDLKRLQSAGVCLYIYVNSKGDIKFYPQT